VEKALIVQEIYHADGASDCIAVRVSALVIKKVIVVNDTMQRGYRYELTDPIGQNFDPEFKPELTPKQMLSMGVFGGKYMTDTRGEFPNDWFAGAKLSPSGMIHL
jgi:hypothetical protein